MGSLDLQVRNTSGADHNLKGEHEPYSQMNLNLWGYGYGTTVLIVVWRKIQSQEEIYILSKKEMKLLGL